MDLRRDTSFQQKYCIIFGAAAQSEHLCGRYFCTHFKEDDKLWLKE